MRAERNPMSGTDVQSLFSGGWIYRSFYNVKSPLPSDPAAAIKQILLAEGKMQLGVNTDGMFGHSTLSFGDGYPMQIQGGIASSSPGAPLTVQFFAYGVPGTQTAGWVYSYIGFLAPTWPYGINQTKAIVGTVTRVVSHGEGHDAGAVYSFIAVKSSSITG
jgi:hypothetical protein